LRATTGEKPRGAQRKAVGVIRSPATERSEAEEIRRRLSAKEGVGKVDIDVLRAVIHVEYDPDLVSLDEIREAAGRPL